MSTKQLAVEFDVKATDSAAGTFSGIASVYGVTDLGGDVVMPGAFTKTIKERGGEVPLLWQHSMREPIGRVMLKDSPTGLLVEGEIDLEIPEGKRAHNGLKKRYIKGLSIGYDTIKEQYEGKVRKLHELKLWEVSVVTFPMNPLAQVDVVKAAATHDSDLMELRRLTAQINLMTVGLRLDRLAKEARR